MSEERYKDPTELLGRLKNLGRRGSEDKSSDERKRRASQRVSLPIPVEIKIGQGDFHATRLGNVSLHGMMVEDAGPAPPGEIAALQFEGYPGVCGPFLILGRVARTADDDPPGLGVEIDFQATGEEAAGQFKLLVRHFLRHRGLLEDIWKGYFEGRCKSCGWIGRVGERSPRCPKCGKEDIAPVADQQGPA